MWIRPRHLAGLLALAALVATPKAPRGSARSAENHPVVARITAKTPAEVERVEKMGLDLLEECEGDELFILTTPEEVARLQGEGWTVALDEEQSRNLPHADVAPGKDTYLGGYRTVTRAVGKTMM